MFLLRKHTKPIQNFASERWEMEFIGGNCRFLTANYTNTPSPDIMWPCSITKKTCFSEKTDCPNSQSYSDGLHRLPSVQLVSFFLWINPLCRVVGKISGVSTRKPPLLEPPPLLRESQKVISGVHRFSKGNFGGPRFSKGNFGGPQILKR